MGKFLVIIGKHSTEISLIYKSMTKGLVFLTCGSAQEYENKCYCPGTGEVLPEEIRRLIGETRRDLPYEIYMPPGLMIVFFGSVLIFFCAF